MTRAWLGETSAVACSSINVHARMEMNARVFLDFNISIRAFSFPLVKFVFCTLDLCFEFKNIAHRNIE